MYSARKSSKIKIFMSRYIGKQSQTYDFQSVQQEDFIFQYFQCQFRHRLYFYFNQREQFIVSTSMDISNSLSFIIALDISQTEMENVFHFRTIYQLTKQTSQLIFRPAKKIISPTRNEDREISVESIANLIKKKQPLKNLYFSGPLHRNIKKQQVWFVPRYMKKFQLEEDMILRFYKSKINQINQNQNSDYENEDQNENEERPSFQEMQICELVCEYNIQQVHLLDIKNNDQLSKENQMNLFHISDEYIQGSGVEDRVSCYICLESQQEKINKKVSPNIFINICGCTGGNKFVHLKCITTWIYQNGIYNSNSCKMCKKPFPQFVEVNRINEKSQKITRYFHLIGGNSLPYIRFGQIQVKMSSNQIIFIGNLPISTIKINSLEKQKLNYAIIQYDAKAEKAYICDMKSKVGTLVKKEKMIYKTSKSESQQTCTLLIHQKWLLNISLDFAL